MRNSTSFTFKFLIIAFILTACGDGRMSPQGGTITNGIAGTGLTGGGTGGAITFNVIGSSDFSVGADLLDLSTTVTAPGTLDVVGNFSVATNKFNVTAVSGNTAIAGTLGVVGSTALAGAIYETGTQTTTSTGTQDDFVINATTTRLHANNGATLSIDGFKCGSSDCASGDDGRQLRVCAVGGFKVIFANEAGGSVAANRILTENGATITMLAGASSCADLEYDGTATRWRFVGSGMRGMVNDGASVISAQNFQVATAAGAGAGGSLQVGADTSAATAARNGVRITTFSDGNNYLDFKSFASGTTVFRSGAGAEAGTARTWLTVTNGTAAVAFPGVLTATGGLTTGLNLTTTGTGDLASGDDLTVADDTTLTDTLTVNGNTQLGNNSAVDTVTFTARAALTNTDSTATAFTIAETLTAGTTNNTYGITLTNGSTIDTTAGSLNAGGINVNASATRSTGANDLVVNGLNVSASGGQSVRGARIAVTGATETSSYGALITNSVTTGAAEGINVAVTGAATTNTAATLTATGASTNIALQTVSGNVILNSTGGTFTATAGGTTTANWTTTGTGDLVSGDDLTVADDTTLTDVLTVNGNVTLGDAITDTVTVTGALNGYTQVTQAADQDVTNAGLTDSNTLTISVAAGKIYAIEAFITAGGSDTTGDYIFDLAVAAGTMDCTGTELSVTTADAIQTTTVIATAAADTADTSVGTRADASLPIAVRFNISCKVSNTTTLKYRFGNASAAAARVSRTMAGSYIKYKLLN